MSQMASAEHDDGMRADNAVVKVNQYNSMMVKVCRATVLQQRVRVDIEQATPCERGEKSNYGESAQDTHRRDEEPDRLQDCGFCVSRSIDNNNASLFRYAHHNKVLSYSQSKAPIAAAKIE